MTQVRTACRTVSARHQRISLRRTLSSSVLTAGIFLTGGYIPGVGPGTLSAFAAEAESASAAKTDIEEVIITGSRIVRDGYEAPTPTTVVGVEEFLAHAPPNIADYLNQLPQLGNATSPLTTRGSSNTIGGNSNLLNMRGLGLSWRSPVQGIGAWCAEPGAALPAHRD
jgi:outer membrane receptor protein involved in Fe transport